MDTACDMASIIMRDLRHDLLNNGLTLEKLVALAKRIAKKHPDDPDIAELAQGLDQGYSELAVLIERVVEIKTLGINPCFENIALRSAIDQVASELELREKNFLQFELICCETITVHADLCLLKVALRQLLQNALQALGESGRIVISGQKVPGKEIVAITIADNGCGIPEDIQEKIFEPHFSHGKIGHSGMGMALVQEALSYIGGTLSLSSQVGKGTTFSIILPCTLKCGRKEVQ